MTDERKMTTDIRAAIDACTRGVDEAPTLRYRVLQQAKGEEPMAKKISFTLVFAIVLVILTATAVATTLLWRDAGEKVAPLEGENGYYDTWEPGTKVKLVQALYDLGELKDNEDAQRVVSGEGLTEEETNALCDKIMTEYIDGTVDVVTLDSILEKLNGDISTWSMEDKVWYNELLERNGMLSADHEDYILPQAGEIGELEAIRIAREFLEAAGAEILPEARPEATMTTNDEYPGSRHWSVVFWQGYTTPSADVLADGTVLFYSINDFTRLYLYGAATPDADAIPKEKALELGKQAILDRCPVQESELTGLRAYYGYVDLDEPEVTKAQYGQYVWCVTCDQEYYARMTPAGEILTAEALPPEPIHE